MQRVQTQIEKEFLKGTTYKMLLIQDSAVSTMNEYFSAFQLAVQENYRNNPFHNFRHCFCVSQMMYGMIHLCNLQVWCSLRVWMCIRAHAFQVYNLSDFSSIYAIFAK